MALLFLCLFTAMASHATQVPPSVYQRYQSLDSQFAAINAQPEKTTSEDKTTLLAEISNFYQQQSTHSLARQLLGSNLYLPVLLQKQQYQQAYQVV